VIAYFDTKSVILDAEVEVEVDRWGAVKHRVVDKFADHQIDDRCEVGGQVKGRSHPLTGDARGNRDRLKLQ
jgi:hypothetical protein